MGGEGGCNRAGHFHCRAVWYRRVTPKSIEQPPIAVGACSTEFRNETEPGTFRFKSTYRELPRWTIINTVGASSLLAIDPVTSGSAASSRTFHRSGRED